jgi:hypothetical protein
MSIRGGLIRFHLPPKMSPQGIIGETRRHPPDINSTDPIFLMIVRTSVENAPYQNWAIGTSSPLGVSRDFI